MCNADVALVRQLVDEFGPDCWAVYRAGLSRGLDPDTGYQVVGREISARTLAAATGISVAEIDEVQSHMTEVENAPAPAPPLYEGRLSFDRRSGAVISLQVKRIARPTGAGWLTVQQPATTKATPTPHGQHGREAGSSRRSTAKRSSSSSSGEDGEPPPPRGGFLAGLTPRQVADFRNWWARARVARADARDAELALLTLRDAALECRTCGESKPRDQFPIRENGRVRSTCKRCESKRVCARYHERKRVVA